MPYDKASITRIPDLLDMTPAEAEEHIRTCHPGMIRPPGKHISMAHGIDHALSPVHAPNRFHTHPTILRVQRKMQPILVRIGLKWQAEARKSRTTSSRSRRNRAA